MKAVDHPTIRHLKSEAAKIGSDEEHQEMINRRWNYRAVGVAGAIAVGAAVWLMTGSAGLGVLTALIYVPVLLLETSEFAAEAERNLDRQRTLILGTISVAEHVDSLRLKLRATINLSESDEDILADIERECAEFSSDQKNTATPPLSDPASSRLSPPPNP